MPKKRRRKIKATHPKKAFNSINVNNISFHKLDWLEKIAIVFSVWFLFYPHPYMLLLSILLVLPVAGILLNGWHKPSLASLVQISKDKNGEDKYDVADFINLPALVILVRVILDFNFESYYSLIIPGSIACLLMLTILFLTHSLIASFTKNRWWIYTSLIFNVCLYSYAGTYAANCTYDQSSPSSYKTEVLDKRVQSGSKGRKIYYIKVAPWGSHHEKEEVSVPADEYSNISIGEDVTIDLKKGLFNIPWFYVKPK